MRASLEADPAVPAGPLERLRGGWAPFLLYPLLALLTFPTLGLLGWGHDGLVYAHDLLDIPRSGILDDWVRYGLTLWNTHVASGNAMLAQQAIGPFAIDVPISFVVGAFGALLANGWLLAATAGVSMHLFLRDSLRLSTLAVLTGAVLFTFSFWHPIIGFAIPLTPLLLWSAERALVPGRTRWRYGVVHVAAGAFALYNGQSQIVVLLAAFELAYLWLGAGLRGPRAIGAWALLWTGSFGVYAPVLATQLPLLQASQRSSWQLNSGSLPAVLTEVGKLYAAVLVGVPLPRGWAASPSIYGTFWLGAAGLPLLAAAALGQPPRRVQFLLLALLAVPLLDAIRPLIAPLLDRLGPLDSFQVIRVRHLFVFALMAAAAAGVDALPGVVRDRRRPVIAAAGIPLVATGLAALAGLYLQRHALEAMQPKGFGWVLAIVAVAVSGILAVVVGHGLLRTPAGRRAALVPLVALVLLVGERAIYAPAERLLGGELGTWAQSLDPTPAQRYLLDQPGATVDRVLTFGDDANRMGAVGLVQADGYQTIYPAAYQRLFGALIRPTLDKRPVLTAYFDHWGNRAIAFGPAVNPALVELLGIRWLYVGSPPPPTYDTFLYPGLPWMPTVPGAVERFHDANATVYEVPSVLPRAFIAGTVTVLPDLDAVVAAMAAASRDQLGSAAWVSAADGATTGLPTSGAAAVPRPAGTATITTYTPDRVVVDTTSTRDGVLVLTDVLWPGWVADVDGTPVDVHPVDAAFRGVPLPAGTHRVTFRYVPAGTLAGGVAALLTVVLVVAGALLLRRHDATAALQ